MNDLLLGELQLLGTAVLIRRTLTPSITGCLLLGAQLAVRSDEGFLESVIRRDGDNSGVVVLPLLPVFGGKGHQLERTFLRGPGTAAEDFHHRSKIVSTFRLVEFEAALVEYKRTSVSSSVCS